MYEQFWKLRAKPFEDGCDPRFFLAAGSHQAALLKLRYAVESGRAMALLAGPPGVGKTLVTCVLKGQLGPQFQPIVHLVFPCMDNEELLVYLAAELTGGVANSPSEAWRKLQNTLVQNRQKGRHALVVVDEAHLIKDHGSWELLRGLLNIQADHNCCLTLLVVGRSSLVAAVNRMRQLEQRVAVKCLLHPLTVEETAQYLRHRLKCAGSEEGIFSPDTVELIHKLTGGIPRRINRLCDLAMLVAFAEESKQVTTKHITSVNEELVAVTA